MHYKLVGGAYVLYGADGEPARTSSEVAIAYAAESQSVLTHGVPDEMAAWVKAHNESSEVKADVLVLHGVSADTVNMALESPKAFKALLATHR